MKRLHILKAGKFTAANGKVYEFTAADLRTTAAAYDPAKHEAPLVIGHPRQDAPAYCWASGLQFDEEGLWAEPDQVDAAFDSLVAEGKFKKRSASFYEPDHPANPVPGTYYLRHIGFLGAQPPAVKGLKAVSFAEGEEKVAEFGDWNDRLIARMLRRMKNVWIEKFGKEEADKLIDEWDLESIQEEALRPAPPPAEPEFTEPRTKEPRMTKEELERKERELTSREAAFTEREGKIKTQERQARREKDVAFAEGLVKAGKLLPQHQGFVADFLEALSAEQSQEATVAFSEGKKVAPREAFCQFLEDLGSHPLFKEMARPAGDKDPNKGAESAECLTGHV